MDEVIARSLCATLLSWEGKEFNLSSVLSFIATGVKSFPCLGIICQGMEKKEKTTTE